MKRYSIFIISLVVAAGCHNASRKEMGTPKAAADEAGATRSADPSADFIKANVSIPVERKLIKTGQLDMKVGSVEKTRQDIEKLTKDFNAYIANENNSNYDDRIQYSLIIRIPSGQFDDFTNKVSALADKVESKTVTVQDVTEEFVDAEARLKTKKELSARYHEILKEAKTVTDILAVESQIGNVQSEIESMEGRLKYLGDQSALSTLTINFHQPIGLDFGFGSKVIRAIGQGWDNLLYFIVGVVYLWPFGILLGVAFWWYRRAGKKKKELPDKNP